MLVKKFKRSYAYQLRSAIHEAEQTIPKSEATQIAEYERDLIASACVELWDLDWKSLLGSLRRLTNGAPERRGIWEKLYQKAQDLIKAGTTAYDEPVA